jgi:glycosyltransferase involved in cell wall biosynthesis
MSSQESTIAILLSVYDNEKSKKWLRARRAQLLTDCLESVLAAKRIADENATWLEIKIIVVDDGSRPPVSQSFSFSDSDVEVIRLDENSGQAAALSTALKSISSDYVAFTDSDCVVDSQWLNVLADHYNSFPNHCGVGGPNWIHKLPGGAWGNWVNRQESALMRYSIERYIDYENKTTERIDFRNISFKKSELDALTSGKYFCALSGPSVSNQFSHYLRPRLLEHGRVVGFSTALLVTHTSVPGVWQQMRSYYDRSRRGDYRIWYSTGNQSVLWCLLKSHFKKHFWDAVARGNVSLLYVTLLHAAYWFGVLRQQDQKERKLNRSHAP